MTRKLGILGIALLLGSTAAMAFNGVITIPGPPNIENGLYVAGSQLENSIVVWGESPVVPMTGAAAGMPEGSKAGPISTTPIVDFGGGRIGVSGSAIVGPRGGSFLTAERRAEMEISRLIRRLN